MQGAPNKVSGQGIATCAEMKEQHLLLSKALKPCCLLRDHHSG